MDHGLLHIIQYLSRTELNKICKQKLHSQPQCRKNVPSVATDSREMRNTRKIKTKIFQFLKQNIFMRPLYQNTYRIKEKRTHTRAQNKR